MINNFYLLIVLREFLETMTYGKLQSYRLVAANADTHEGITNKMYEVFSSDFEKHANPSILMREGEGAKHLISERIKLVDEAGYYEDKLQELISQSARSVFDCGCLEAMKVDA